MQKIMDDVREFSTAGDVETHPYPQWPSQKELELRRKLINEEAFVELVGLLDEVIADPEKRTLENMVLAFDGALDSIYVLAQFMVVCNLPATKGWEIVQRANMAKVDGTTGKLVKGPDGKILKPAGWTAADPELLELLKVLIEAGQQRARDNEFLAIGDNGELLD